MDLIVAAGPLVVLVVGVTVAGWAVPRAATVALATVLAAAGWWGVTAATIAGSTLRGLFIAVEILILVVGALAIVALLERLQLFAPIRARLATISGDHRVQTLVIAFAMVSVLEGAAGFGTPALFAIPLLVALGFAPVHAVVLALVGDSIPVVFGAIGVPVTLGVGSVLAPLTPDAAAITDDAAAAAALLNIFAAPVVANVLVWLSVAFRGEARRAAVEMVPFATMAGLAVAVPAWVVAVTLGPALPSIIGGLVGLVALSLLARHGVLLPATARSQPGPPAGVPVDAPVAPESTSAAGADRAAEAVGAPGRTPTLVRALVPYLCLVSLLVVTRMPLFGLDDWFADQAVELAGLAGSDVDYRLAPLVSPAIALAVVAVVSVLALGADLADGRRALAADVFRRTVAPAMALIPVLVFVQIFVNSTPATGDPATMPAVIAGRLGDVVGGGWPLVGPAVGALGSFVSGSATVSNLVFTGLVHDVAVASDLDVADTVALQMNGAAMGNMVALHNVIAALTVAGLGHDRTRDVLRRTIVPMAALVAIFGLAGWMLSLA